MTGSHERGVAVSHQPFFDSLDFFLGWDRAEGRFPAALIGVGVRESTQDG